jgi:hypothetical protein
MSVLTEAKKEQINIVLQLRLLKALRAIQILQGLGLEGKINVKPKQKNNEKPCIYGYHYQR